MIGDGSAAQGTRHLVITLIKPDKLTVSRRRTETSRRLIHLWRSTRRYAHTAHRRRRHPGTRRLALESCSRARPSYFSAPLSLPNRQRRQVRLHHSPTGCTRITVSAARWTSTPALIPRPAT